jgi:hypothetical protein
MLLERPVGVEKFQCTFVVCFLTVLHYWEISVRNVHSVSCPHNTDVRTG